MFQVLLLFMFIFILAFHLVFYHKYHLPKYVKEIDKIPGPKGVFYFGNILRFYQLKSEEMLTHLTQEFKTWGPTLRYWYSGVAVVVISDVDDVQAILTSKSNYEKGLMYEHLKPWLGTGLLISKGDKWKMMRKIITPTFHFSILQTSMGKCINSQVTKSENDYVKAIFRIGQIVVERLFSPFLYTNHMFMLSPLGRENANLLKTLHGVTSKLIQERKQRHLTESFKYDEDEENGRKKIPFLDLLIEKQKIFYFSDNDLRQEVDTVLMAGHDTTSTALSWCFFELGYREDIQDKIYNELEKIFEGSDRDPTYQDLMEMEYLKRVLQETLRLYPSVPVISRKFDVEIKLKNYTVPAGTDIVLVFYHIHRNPQIFPNPEYFDPDRFLPDEINRRNPFAYIPFSAGPRNCLGQKYAMLQMLVMSSYILRKYKLTTLNKRESVRAMPDVILRPNVQLQWKLTSRD